MEKLTDAPEESLEAIYNRRGVALFRLALLITRDRAASEDIVQEAFAILIGRRAELKEVVLEGYLFRTVRNLALNHERHLRVRRKAADALKRDSLYEAKGPGDAEEAELATRALEALPVEQREVVVLRLYGELSFREIAAHSEAPLGTVHSRFRYAMQTLRSLLESER